MLSQTSPKNIIRSAIILPKNISSDMMIDSDKTLVRNDRCKQNISSEMIDSEMVLNSLMENGC